MPIQSRSNVTDLLLRAHSSVRVALIEPAATFTNTTPSSSGGGTTTTLTSAGAHGLTAAVAVGASIYISAGTGWTVGFYTITALDLDTTGVAITINTPFSAGFGTPTIALANTQVSLVSVPVPTLFPNSYIKIDVTWGFTSSGNNKIVQIVYDSFAAAGATATTSLADRMSTIISNRGATNSQLGGFSGTSNASYGFGISSTATKTGTIDSTSSKNVIFTGNPAAANEIIAVDRYIITVWR